MRFIISESPIIVYSALQRITRAALTTTGISCVAGVPIILISSRITRVYVCMGDYSGSSERVYSNIYIHKYIYIYMYIYSL